MAITYISKLSFIDSTKKPSALLFRADAVTWHKYSPDSSSFPTKRYAHEFLEEFQLHSRIQFLLLKGVEAYSSDCPVELCSPAHDPGYLWMVLKGPTNEYNEIYIIPPDVELGDFTRYQV